MSLIVNLVKNEKNLLIISKYFQYEAFIFSEKYVSISYFKTYDKSQSFTKPLLLIN